MQHQRTLTGGEQFELPASLEQQLIDRSDVATALAEFGALWESLTPREQVRVLELLIERVTYSAERSSVSITFRPSRDQDAGRSKSGGQSMRGLAIDRTVHFSIGRRSRKELRQAAPPPPVVQRVPRISRLMALAIRFDQMIQDGTVADQAELARLGHVTRARLTQIMNLLNLAPDIQEAILFLKHNVGREQVTERNKYCRGVLAGSNRLVYRYSIRMRVPSMRIRPPHTPEVLISRPSSVVAIVAPPAVVWKLERRSTRIYQGHSHPHSVR